MRAAAPKRFVNRASAGPVSQTFPGSLATSRGWILVALVFLPLALAVLPAQAQTGYVSTVVGATGSSTAGLLNQPQGVAVDGTGNLYIADTGNCVIWEVPTSGPPFIFAGELGNCTGSYSSITPTQVSLNHPVDVAANCGGTVFVADTASSATTGLHAITGGVFSNLNVSFQGTRDVIGYVQPQAIACDTDGDLFIESTFSFLDENEPGYELDALTPGGTLFNIVTSILVQYQGVAVDANRNVYSIQGPVIEKFEPGTLPNTWLAVGAVPQGRNLTGSTRLAMDPAGNFYANEGTVSNPSAIVYITKIAQGTGTVTYAAGTGVSGFNTDGPALGSTVELSNPTGLAAGSSILYFADTGNSRVRGFQGASLQMNLTTATPPVCFPTAIITMTATAEINGSPAPAGSVSFFDGVNLLGTVQIVRNTADGSVLGTATLKTFLGVGTHALQAKFQGPGTAAISGVQDLSVCGTAGTATTLTAQADMSNSANFDFLATVFGFSFGASAPNGSVSFASSASSTSLPGSPVSLTAASLPPNGVANGFDTLPPFTNVSYPAAAGDLNGDGIPDLVVFDDTSADGHTMGIMLGKGDGTFLPEIYYCFDNQPAQTQQPITCGSPAAGEPTGAAILDVNGDGIPDVVVLAASGDILVFLGTGNGALNPSPIISSFSNGGFNLAIGDVNNDGIPDLVVTSTNDQTDTVLLGDGTGKFNLSQVISVTGAGQSVIADFNSDGKPDIATTNYLVEGVAGSPNSVSILLGNGDGTFGPPITVLSSTFDFPYALLAADLNNDGMPDLAVLSTSGPTGLTVILNNGAWTSTTAGFSSGVGYATGTEPSKIVTADFNGDGWPDLLVGNGDSYNSLSLFLSNPGNTSKLFLPQQNYDGIGGYLAMVEGDFNGDSIPDVAVAGLFNDNVLTFVDLGATESTAMLSDVNVGSAKQTVTAAFAPTGTTYSASSGSVIVNGLPPGTETLTLSPPSFAVYAGSTSSVNLEFTPITMAILPPTGNVTLTATNGDLIYTTTTFVSYAYVPLYPGGEPVNFDLPSAGTWKVVVTYSGDSNWQSATSNTLTITTATITSALTLTGPATATAGVPFNVFPTFSNGGTGGGPPPTGNINIIASNGTTTLTLATQPVSSFYDSSYPISVTIPTAGTWQLEATYPGDSVWSPVTSAPLPVTVSGGITVTISPSNARVTVGQSQQFTAVVTGTTTTSVTWSVTPPTGCGTITLTGLYQAPLTMPIGTCMVTATSTVPGGGSASVTVQIIGGAPPPASPVITSISPANGTQGQQGLQVTITGSNFVAGSTTVTIGANVGAQIGVSLATVTSTSMTAQINIPETTPPGSYDVVVTVAGAPTSAMLTGGFAVTAVAINISETIAVNDQPFEAQVLSVAAPYASYSNSSLGFAGQPTQTLILSNGGQQPLSITSVAFSNSAFALGPISCSTPSSSIVTTIPSGGSCLLTIAYTSNSGGSATGTLMFTDNAAASNVSNTQSGTSYIQSIGLNGTASTNGAPISQALVSITIMPSTATVNPGSPQHFTAIGLFSDGSTSDITNSVVWSSSTPPVATISNTTGSQGLATAISAGDTTITATSGTISATASLIVPIFISETVTVTDEPSVAAGLSATQISVTASGLLYSRVTKAYSGTVTITNTSGNTLNGPFQLVLTGLISGAMLTNATGSYNGSPYISVTSPAGLAAKQAVGVTVLITYGGSAKITFTPVVYSGTF